MIDLEYSNVIPVIKERDLLKALTESSIIAFTDVRGNIIYVNDKFCEISKYRREELLGRNHRIIKSGYHPHEFYDDLWKTIVSGKIWTGEIKNRAKDGAYYWVFTTIIPFLNEHGKPYQYASIRIDITEKKKIEEDRDKALVEFNNARIEQVAYEKFVSTLAHDLRTPLTVASASAQLIQRNPEISDKVKSLASKVENNVKRANEMIKNMLDANQINNGHKPSMIIEECDAGELIKSSLDDLTVIYGHRFVLKKSENLKGHWSPSGLKRILENLCMNAIKYGNPDRPVTINLTNNTGKLELTVHNEGKPLSVEELKELFDYLHRTHSAKTSNKIGWGIGLTLVRGMTEAHGGTAEVKSSPVEGTTFIIQLPLDARPFQVI